ncbi:MAG: L-2-hydroxyglutarate oxidase [Planctomycetota bacterium]|nr:MAG: L-2-hydroxyglutarate oxidase [Planctomycetota bacterium]
MTVRADIVIVGGGIVGLATAYRLLERCPDLRVVVLEKESDVGVHQTGHNSGVLHSGIYYRPGSLRAVNCREGKRAMEEFCRREGIPFELCGKVIVAVEDWELPILERIFERGQANQVRCELIDRQRLLEIEPHTAGIRAIHVPEAGIVDFRRVCRRLAEIVRDKDGQILCGARAIGMRSTATGVVVESTQAVVEARAAVTAAGLHSDRVARLAGMRPESRIVPFRGEYYKLKPTAEHLCRGLIYPVPDPAFPFLGVHFTRMIGGGVECGPNAVLAFAREGYRKTDVNLRDLAETLTYPGFLRLAARHWKTGCAEMWRSLSKRAFVRALQRLVPQVRCEDVEPAPAGVRAQALARDGRLVDDFVVASEGRIVHVLNAPSPAATSSLNIGRLVVDKLVAHDLV